ncbi:MAG: tRNA epoxyqueuosine(34) reductase QueG [Oligoflexales bacterium]|nr:tRNA epoxyqueuosine(34) reductase QueG [Oligoflexales bacterium]
MDTNQNRKFDDKNSFFESCFEEEGLIFLGIVDLKRQESTDFFRKWLSLGYHSEMRFLERNIEIREDPTRLFPGAKTGIIFALPYYCGDTYDEIISSKNPSVSQYARFPDYHRIMKIKAERVLKKIRIKLGNTGLNSFESRIYTDSAPIFERAFAARTGSGFIGKNFFFIHREKGSFILLGEIITSIGFFELSCESEGKTCANLCRDCQLCWESCPTKAYKNGFFDANRCISYWTIENRGIIPVSYWKWLKWYYFGCDICQLVCPYNKGIPIADHDNLGGKRKYPALFDIAMMEQDFFYHFFKGTPLERATKAGLQRNALIALTVTENKNIIETLKIVKKMATDNTLVMTIHQIEKFLDINKNAGSGT